MASPTQDMIDTYMSITGASHSLALRKLEEYGGNLSEAVNAHFGGVYRDFTNLGSAANPQYNFSHMDGQNQVAPHAYPQYNNMSAQNQVAPQGLGPLLSAARSFRPSLLLDPNYSRGLFNRITGRAPLISQPGAVPGVPVEFNRGNDQPHLSGQRPPIQDMTGNLHGNDVEEEMIRAAIEASKQDAQKAYLLNMQSRAQNVSPVNGLPDNQIHLDNNDFDRAVSLSLKTAEREKAMREQQMKDKNQVPGTYSTSRWETSMHHDGDGNVERKQASQELKHDSGNNLQQGNLAISSEELGGISSKELDEAILLENALSHSLSLSSLAAQALIAITMENYSYNSYPESGNSSPRSRDIDFENTPPWEVDAANSQTQSYKAKFMCSYGGKILPRPHDNQLCYVGGETKIFSVDRNIKFAAIISKLSSLSEYDVSFKYQLPGEDLDALISVTNDDDLEHMMHEYDRLYRASTRPARMRLFLFNASPNGGFGSDDGRSNKDRFVEALNSGPTQAPYLNSKPPVQNNVEFLCGMEKGVVPAAVAPPPPPAPIPEQVAPPPDFVRSGHTERVIGSDPVVSPVEFQRQLQRLQIGEQDQQAMYGRKNDDNLVGGYSGSGDYYVQKMPEKAPPVTAAPPAGYWPEITSGGFPGIGAPEQPMYMFTSAPGGGAVYHAQPPMVRPVNGPPGQEYYHVQQRVGSEIYREQPPRYNVVPQLQQQQPSTLPPQPPKYVATYADTTPYAQVAYDSTTGRQVYYSAPGGVVQQQQQAYQAVGPAAVGGEMRAAGALGQEGKVVGSKLPQASV